MEDTLINHPQIHSRHQFMEDQLHHPGSSGATSDLRCLLNESTFSGPPYTSDADITTSASTWDSNYYEGSSPETADSSFTSSTETLEATPKRRHPGHSANVSLSPQVVHLQKKRSRGESYATRDTNGPNVAMATSTPPQNGRSWSFSETIKEETRVDLQNSTCSPVVYPTNGYSHVQNWPSAGDDETSPRWVPHYDEDPYQNSMAMNQNGSAPYIRSSVTGEDYMDSNKNSPQYQAIAQDLEGILDLRDDKNMNLMSPQPIRRRWRGLAPVPYAQSSPSDVLLQQQTYRPTSPVHPVSLHSSLDGFVYNSGSRGKLQESVSFDSGRRNYAHNNLPPPTPASFNYDNNNSVSNYAGGSYYGDNGRTLNNNVSVGNNANCNAQNGAGQIVSNHNTKEIRWKHQTDMLRTKFSNKGQKNSIRGANDGGPPPLSAKSFITKWKLNV